MNPEVSIIIPTYNRGYLLGETLDSIIAQSFQDWECIVVDDGSGDYTQELMHFYCEKDRRIKFLKKPEDRRKGGNASRNIGFEYSRGKYIQWFDSDDIMMPDHLEEKINILKKQDCDFVVAKLINFSSEQAVIDQYYNRVKKRITFKDFLFRKINWITPDPMLKKSTLLKYNILFNERMSSDQEYNYYCKLLSHTENGVYLDKIVTKRRIHEQSIQSKVDRALPSYKKELFRNRYLTFLDLEKNISSEIKNAYLDQIMTIYFGALSEKRIPAPKGFFLIVFKHKGIKGVTFYFTSLLITFLTGKGYFLLQKSKRKIVF